MWLNALYLAHTVLEIALGGLKLRGRYQHEPPGSKSVRSEMYCRHHGFSLLALALLGYLVWRNDLVDSPTGQAASAVLATFHCGAVVAFLHAFLHGQISAAKVVIPHLPFALAFSWHALL